MLHLKRDDPRTRKFVRSVGLLTSNGTLGHNIMACEWTGHISYDPAIFALHLKPTDLTYKNILQTKEVGISLAGYDQSIITSVVGGSSGEYIDKIKALEMLGVKFAPAVDIDVVMPKGTCMRAEAKVIEFKEIGDHIMCICELINLESEDKDPLIYHLGRYRSQGRQVPKPTDEMMEKIQKTIEQCKR